MLPESIFFNSEKRIVHVRIADIVFAECNHPFVLIYCTGDLCKVRLSLDQVQRILPAGMFLRVHRSFLVSIQHISFYTDGIVYLGDYEIPVQEGKRRKFKAALNIAMPPRVRAKTFVP